MASSLEQKFHFMEDQKSQPFIPSSSMMDLRVLSTFIICLLLLYFNTCIMQRQVCDADRERVHISLLVHPLHVGTR
jgi:uncharacterized membrane protein YhaH (DUF805 family)